MEVSIIEGEGISIINAGGRSTRAYMNGCDGTQESIGGSSSMSASSIVVSSTSTGSPSIDTAAGNYTSTNVLDLKKFYQRQLKEMEMKIALMQEELNCQVMKTSRSNTL